MCSATLDKAVQKVADIFMKEPVLITMGYLGKTPAEITQELVYIDETKKLDFLHKTLAEKQKEDRVLVFVETKKKCTWLETFLRGQKIEVTCLHGDKGQGEREKALNAFKYGRSDILIATDVAQRGLDIPDVSIVLNMDMPRNIED